MNNNAQIEYPVITLIVVIIFLLIVAPVMLKIFNSFQTPFSANLGNITKSGAVAQENFNYAMNTGRNFWDGFLIFVFFLSVIIMFISSFLIDVHPAFIILYIIISFVTILIAPDAIAGIGTIYSMSAFTTEASQLTFMSALLDNIPIILVGLMFLSGLVIFGKVAFFRYERGVRR